MILGYINIRLLIICDGRSKLTLSDNPIPMDIHSFINTIRNIIL